MLNETNRKATRSLGNNLNEAKKVMRKTESLADNSDTKHEDAILSDRVLGRLTEEKKFKAPDSLPKVKEKTSNMQDGFLNSCRHEKVTVVISMLNNTSEKGIIVAFDNNTIIMKNSEDGQFLLMKTAIATIKPTTEVNYIFNNENKYVADYKYHPDFKYNTQYKPYREKNYNSINEPPDMNGIYKPGYRLPGIGNDTTTAYT